jgi:hypothetical protein
MRTKVKYILAIALFFILTAAGLFLPEWMTAYTDQNIIGKVGFESVEMSQIIPSNDTLVIRKISLLRDYPQNVDRVALEMGTNFNLNSASDRFFEEVTELAKLGLLPEMDLADKSTIKMDVSLYVQKDEPSVSGIIWSIALQKDGFFGNFYMDDHTGKMIQFIVTIQDKQLITGKETIETWADYLGLEVQHIEFKPESYSIQENENVKISESSYNVYNFEFKFEDNVLPYLFYTFENGYGLGYTMELISSYNTSIEIRP